MAETICSKPALAYARGV